jgi:hypothetical protein
VAEFAAAGAEILGDDPAVARATGAHTAKAVRPAVTRAFMGSPFSGFGDGRERARPR